MNGNKYRRKRSRRFYKTQLWIKSTSGKVRKILGKLVSDIQTNGEWVSCLAACGFRHIDLFSILQQNFFEWSRSEPKEINIMSKNNKHQKLDMENQIPKRSINSLPSRKSKKRMKKSKKLYEKMKKYK